MRTPWPGAQAGKVSSHLRQQRLRGEAVPTAEPAASPAAKRGRPGAAARRAPDAKRIKVTQNPAFPPPPQPSPPAPAPATRRKKPLQNPAALVDAKGRRGSAKGGAQPSEAGPGGGGGAGAGDSGGGAGGRGCFMAGARLVSALLACWAIPPKPSCMCSAKQLRRKLLGRTLSDIQFRYQITAGQCTMLRRKRSLWQLFRPPCRFRQGQALHACTFLLAANRVRMRRCSGTPRSRGWQCSLRVRLARRSATTRSRRASRTSLRRHDGHPSGPGL